MKRMFTMAAVLLMFSMMTAAAQGMLEERVKTGTPVQVQQVINRDVADVKFQDRDGVSVLMQAAQFSQYPDMVDVLVEAGAPVGAADRQGVTALHYAARYNPDPMMSIRLVSRGADIHVQDRNGWTPLLTAARHNPNKDAVISALKSLGAVFDLHDVIRRGSTEQMDAALSSGLIDITYQDEDGASLLMLAAAETRNTAFIDLLVRRGALIHERDPDGWTPLMYAASRNQEPGIVNALVRHGADVHVRDNDNWSPLLTASRDNPNRRVMEALKNAGAFYHVEQELEVGRLDQLEAALKGGLVTVDQVDETGAELLTLAARSGQDVRILELLIDRGADIEARDSLGRTALSHAAERSGHPEIAEYLIGQGADPASRDTLYGMTPLMYAAWRNPETEILSILADHGTAHRDLLGRTPLMWSLSNPNPEVFRMLLDRGAGIHDRTLKGESLLMVASREDVSGEAVRELLNLGARTDLKDRRGLTALFYSLENEGTRALEVLLEYGARLDIADPAGASPLMHAVSAGRAEIAELLIARGADVNRTDMRETAPLMSAAAGGRTDLVSMLLRSGADVALRDDAGRDALIHGVLSDGPAEVVKALLDAGASVHGFDVYGMTPLMYAARYSTDISVLELLLDAGASPDRQGGYLNMTSLMIAARYSTPEAVTLLLDRGARADILDRSSPPMKAVDHGRLNPEVFDTEVFWEMNNLSY